MRRFQPLPDPRHSRKVAKHTCVIRPGRNGIDAHLLCSVSSATALVNPMTACLLAT
jgi:hypothetical protein